MKGDSFMISNIVLYLVKKSTV